MVKCSNKNIKLKYDLYYFTQDIYTYCLTVCHVTPLICLEFVKFTAILCAPNHIKTYKTHKQCYYVSHT